MSERSERRERVLELLAAAGLLAVAYTQLPSAEISKVTAHESAEEDLADSAARDLAIENGKYAIEAAQGKKAVTVFQGVYLIHQIEGGDSPKTYIVYSPLFRADAEHNENLMYMCIGPNGQAVVLPMDKTSMIMDTNHSGEPLIEGMVSINGDEVVVKDKRTGKSQRHWCELRDGTHEEVTQQLMDELESEYEEEGIIA